MNEKMPQIGLRDPILDIPVAMETLSDEFDPIIDSDAYHWKPDNEETDMAASVSKPHDVI